MKEQIKNDKPDIKNKYYELGWFSTKIKTVEIKTLEDVCDWINAMCELAETGAKRQIWGAKKKDDRGMLGVLNVCKKADFDNLKKLPHGKFDCKSLFKLIRGMNECVCKTNKGRTKSKGFVNTLQNCRNFIWPEIKKILEAGINLQTFIDELDIPEDDYKTLEALSDCVYDFGRINRPSNIKDYKEYANLTNDFFKKIIDENKIEVEVDLKNNNRLDRAKKAIADLCNEVDYWIFEKILDDGLAKELQKNCEAISDGLQNEKIKLVQVEKKS